MPLTPDTRLGPYELVAPLGVGGMGEVFRARDTRLNREVAIKVLPEDFAADLDRLRRFEQEAKTLAALNHPNIMTVFDVGQHEGAPYLVSELLEGRTLREHLAAGPLSARKATDCALQMAQGLAAAHGKGVVHRDLKPDNVFVTRDDRVKILDFGLAKLREVPGPGTRTPTPGHPDASTRLEPVAQATEPGRVMGTPSYMAPEQIRGEAVDHRADLFAFGCVLCEMVSGQRPFGRGTSIETMAAILNDEPPDLTEAKPDVPPALARIVHRCLEKLPERRFQSAHDLAFALDATREQSGPVRGGVPAAPVQRRPAVKVFAWPAVAVMLSVSLAAVSMGWWPTTRTPARASQVRSLAVLPFAFETEDPKLSGLGKWIPAEIRSKLGSLQDLQVVNSPARIEQLLQEKKSEVEVARDLGVDGLVMGELHGQGETISAYVWVVDGATGRALGRQREIAASASKLSEIPNQVALAIVDELKLQVSTSERTEIQVADTQNAEAFLAYQKGSDLLGSRRFDEAAVELRRAYQLDSNYTRAWVALAASEWSRMIYGGTTTTEMVTTFKRLTGEAERFGAQRPDDPAVASLRMWMAMLYERDWKKVSAIFWERQRDPKPDPGVLHVMSWYYTLIEGDPNLASYFRQQTIAMEPERLIFQIDQAHQRSFFGHFDEAVRVFRSLPFEKVQLEDYSYALLKAGDLAGARDVAARVLAGFPNAWTECRLAAIDAKSGAAGEARKILAGLEADAEQGMHIPYGRIAWGYGMVGDVEAARRWLRKGLLEGHGDWSMLELRSAEMLEMFGKLAWYWEIVETMKFPPLQMDNPYFALEQAIRYGRGTSP
ncbi:MAG TPA: serine/threonine-protein kinase [Vicinamibacterales bacterium]|nr:serine/threonine-protein kinase [Vicinamibacterales bacterium]